MAKNVLESFSHLPDSHVVTLTLGELRGKTMPTHVTERPDDTLAKVFKPRQRLTAPHVAEAKAPRKAKKPVRTKKKARRR